MGSTKGEKGCGRGVVRALRTYDYACLKGIISSPNLLADKMAGDALALGRAQRGICQWSKPRTHRFCLFVCKAATNPPKPLRRHTSGAQWDVITRTLGL